MAKEEFIVLKTEKIDLNFYAVRSKEGKWLRKKGYGGGGENWVDDITLARIWGKPAPAKAQITWWATNYPKYGVPDLVMITTGDCLYLDQESRVKNSQKKKELEEAKRKISNLEYDLDYAKIQRRKDKMAIERITKDLEKAKQNLEQLHDNSNR